ncbi:MAG: 2Fe-2S iron-sulfur cluster binding domain-containing protein [Clostridia bacterium]|nr:2Fe-2S iron-sulfur cluster binding domain-containing protein [Clostridia bacterium]
MSKSKIKSLNPMKIVSVIANRTSKIKNSSEEPIPALSSYKANQLAAALHPERQYLKVAKVTPRGEDVKTFTLIANNVKGTSSLAYFSAGQYLSVYLNVDGMPLTRPYSLSSSPKKSLEGKYELTIKKVGGGLASQYILDNWEVGTEVEVSAPLGVFTYEPLRDAKTVVGIAGGSGITPFLSLANAIADGDEDCNLVLLYGSRTVKDILFKEEFDELALRTDKFKVVHVLSNEEAEGYEHGFITAELIKKYAPKGEYSIFLCGPQAMYNFADKEIATLNLKRKFVRHEVFGEYRDPAKNEDYPESAVGAKFKLTVTVDGETYTLTANANDTLLNTLEHNGVAAPAECRSGICGWCRSRLVSGKVYIPKSVDGRRMADKDFGYVHLCSTFPLSDVTIDVPKAKP